MGRYCNDESWLKNYDELKLFYKKNGNVNVSPKYVTDDGVKLGIWLKKQKELYSKGRLKDDRIELLENLGIIWNFLEEKWNNNYKYLINYYNMYGNIDVPQLYTTSNGFPLGKWLYEQRIAYKNRVLNKRRVKLLKKLNIKWNPRVDTWDENYYELEEYYNLYGNINVPNQYITDKSTKLGRWVYIQRQAYRSGIIDKDHRMLLNDLGMDWCISDSKVLNSVIDNDNIYVYKKVMLKRIKNILNDLSYEIDFDITDVDKLKTVEKEIVKRMWK